MVIVGLILLLLAIAVIAFVVLATQGMADLTIDYGILNLSISPLWLFLAGGLTLAVATSACWLVGVGARVANKKRAEVKALRKQAKESDRRTERVQTRSSMGTKTSATTTGRTPTSTSSSTPTTAPRSLPPQPRPDATPTTPKAAPESELDLGPGPGTPQQPGR